MSLNPPEKNMGWRGSDTRSVFFKDMRIQKSTLLGNPSKGFKQFLKTLTGGRITIGAFNSAINRCGSDTSADARIKIFYQSIC